MSSIMDRLRQMADLFEAQHAPHNMVLHIRAAADEIARLRERLEVDPAHPYDGIYARDKTIRLQEAEIKRLQSGGCARDQGVTQYCAEAARLAKENEKLRAVLEGK